MQILLKYKGCKCCGGIYIPITNTVYIDLTTASYSKVSCAIYLVFPKTQLLVNIWSTDLVIIAISSMIVLVSILLVFFNRWGCNLGVTHMDLLVTGDVSEV